MELGRKLGPGSTIVTILCDYGNRYLSKLYNGSFLKEKGLHRDDFSSRMLNEKMLRAATHVFAMSGHHLAAIEDEFPEHADKVYLVSEFTQEDAIRGKDVSDPFGAGRAAYEDTLADLEKMLPSLVAYIDQTHKES
jgi:protein-tyrosine-phosphatase